MIVKNREEKLKRIRRKKGNKARVDRKVEECKKQRKRRYGKDDVRKTCVDKLKPVIETKSVSVGGIQKKIPIRVREGRGVYRACSWIRDSVLKRVKKSKIPMEKARRRERIRLYDEINERERISKRIGKGIDTRLNRGRKRESEPRLRRERMHRGAKANEVNE